MSGDKSTMKFGLCPVWSRVENKGEGKMYGLLLESVQFYVIQDVGEETWNKILEHAGVKNIVFTTHNTYRDELMTLLAQSCCHVTKTKDYNQWMTFFGTCFVEFCRSYGYDKLLRVTGRNYRDFLHGIDNIHEVIRFSYPRLQSPAFLVLTEDKDGCVMLYQTKRRGFKHYVIGQLQQVAKRFYNILVSISVIEEEIIDRKTHVRFRLDFDNSAYKPKSAPKQLSGTQNFSSITGDTFLKVFPFCIVFNSQLVIRMVGSSMVALLKGDNLIGAKVREKFHIRRPLIPCIWSKIMQFRRVIFEVEYLFDNDPSVLDARLIDYDNSEAETAAEHRILLRGEMKHLPEWNMIAFLCTPLLCDLKDLKHAGLYINDLNLFDMSRDMVMAGWQHASQLERSIEEQKGKSEKITDNMVKIEEWQEKSDSLLYNMIPKSVAGKLKSGGDPISTCEVFDNVTIMFNYMVGFGDVCSSATPMLIVEIINTVFSLFDQIIDSYDVFKVETLGDAVYMVAGGVPDRNPNHALSVAGLALELQEKAKTLTDPWSKEYKLNTRIGMHTGSVVGGVVGRRMPQYCLFGDTVNTASRMQTYSLPGRIHISEPCQQCLKQTSFVTIVRGTVNVKGKGEMRTFWLAGKEGEESTRKFCEEIKQERNESVRKYSSYENAMDLHAMHASTSFAQMPAYFGGMKSNRSASSISLSKLQQCDDDGVSELKPNERFGIKGSSRSSFSRLTDFRRVSSENTDQIPASAAMFENAEPVNTDTQLADDERDRNASIKDFLDMKTQNFQSHSDTSMCTKFNIPKIVENDENGSNENMKDSSDKHEERKQRLTLSKFKLSLPKLPDLSHIAIPANLSENTANESYNIAVEDKSDVADASSAESSKIKVFLGSDDGLSVYDTENNEEISAADNNELKDSWNITPRVSFSLFKSGSSFEEINEDLYSEAQDENSTDIMFDLIAATPPDQNTQRDVTNYEATALNADKIPNQSFDKCQEPAVADKRPSENTQNGNFIPFVTKSIEHLTLQTVAFDKNDITSNTSCKTDIAPSNQSFTNGYLGDLDVETETHAAASHDHSEADKDNIDLEILSCPFFASIANGNANESSNLNSLNLRKCAKDQGCTNGNHTSSTNHRLPKILNINGEAEGDELDSNVSNHKIRRTSNEAMNDHVTSLETATNAVQTEKLKLLETRVKMAWGLNDKTAAELTEDTKTDYIRESYKENSEETYQGQQNTTIREKKGKC